jgi:acyl-CoA thioester hydrolase
MSHPQVLNDFKINIPIQVAWADMDVLGHVNSTRYFAYFEIARIKYYEQLELTDYFSRHKITGVLSKVECNYLVPLHYPDNITVGARVTHISSENLIMEYYLKSESHGLSAIGEAEIVFYNTELKKKVCVPDLVKEKIIKFENCTF